MESFKQSNLINSDIYLSELARCACVCCAHSHTLQITLAGTFDPSINSLQKKQDAIADLLPKFWSMDVAGKHMFVDMVRLVLSN